MAAHGAVRRSFNNFVWLTVSCLERDSAVIQSLAHTHTHTDTYRHEKHWNGIHTLIDAPNFAEDNISSWYFCCFLFLFIFVNFSMIFARAGSYWSRAHQLRNIWQRKLKSSILIVRFLLSDFRCFDVNSSEAIEWQTVIFVEIIYKQKLLFEFLVNYRRQWWFSGRYENRLFYDDGSGSRVDNSNIFAFPVRSMTSREGTHACLLHEHCRLALGDSDEVSINRWMNSIMALSLWSTDDDFMWWETAMLPSS